MEPGLERQNGTVQYEVHLVTRATLEEVEQATQLVLKEMVSMGFGLLSCQLSELHGLPVLTLVCQRGLTRVISRGDAWR